MAAVIVLGVLAGGGLCLAYTALVPARPTLAATITAVTTIAPPPPPAPVAGVPVRGIVAPLARALHRHGLPRRGITADLTICDREPVAFLSTQLLVALAAGFGPALPLAAATSVLGTPSWALPLWALLLGAAAGAAIMQVRLHAAAEVRRAQLRAALSVMLDLTVVAISGGAGVEQALAVATHPRLRGGWALRQLRTAITAAGHAGVTSWQTFTDLGTATGVTQLVDLAAAVALTGSEGAHIRDSLAARAETLRARQAAELKAAARSTTQRMILPLMVIGAGYVLFLIFPAIYAVTTSF